MATRGKSIGIFSVGTFSVVWNGTKIMISDNSGNIKFNNDIGGGTAHHTDIEDVDLCGDRFAVYGPVVGIQDAAYGVRWIYNDGENWQLSSVIIGR